MAYKKRRGYYSRGSSAQSQDDDKDWTPMVDKNPFYRTMDILNGVFKKKVKLVPGKFNATDLKTIMVNFGEKKFVPVLSLKYHNEKGKPVYDLNCGHEFIGSAASNHQPGKHVPCSTCGGAQAYLGFEHEWQHIIFKSNPDAQAVFVKNYAKTLKGQYPHIDVSSLVGFLNLFINVFDDIRVNSLWEKVYPGSAQQIWERWRRITTELGTVVNENFLAYIFAVEFGLPTDPNGKFEPTRPVIEWGVQKVKYRGFGNMLIDVRAVLDRCVGAILASVSAAPTPPQLADPQQSSDCQQQQQGAGSDSSVSQAPDEDQADDLQKNQGAGTDASAQGAEQGEGSGGSLGLEADSSQDQGKDSPPPPTQIPSAKDAPGDPSHKSAALRQLMTGANPVDEQEQHPEGDSDSTPSAGVTALVAHAMNADISDLSFLDSQMPQEPDADMAQAIQQLQDGLAHKSVDSQLTSGAKANVLIIDVDPQGMSGGVIDLTSEERFAVNRMRSAFFRALGRQKAKRSAEGHVVDVPALIQYLGDHQDPDVFEGEEVQQGFAYSILCDMSGSMHSDFRLVCHAVEMLKQALDFPFVVGNLWGFRGGESVPGHYGGNAEVWLYRYHPRCRSYTGRTSMSVPSQGTIPGYPHRNFTVSFPVGCGGLTPMNSAIHVAARHLWRHMPSGMAKRLFVLTDGAPCHTKTAGGAIPNWLLRQFVAKEVSNARQHGVQVYTLVIGEHSISDSECRQMFGPYQYWKKVSSDGDNRVDKVLAKLVLENFTRYIKSRG